mgnify:CR=1 FL=1
MLPCLLLVWLVQVALFLTAPGTLDPSLALGLYVKCGTSDWLYRGCVHNGHPSEVMPLQVWMYQPAGSMIQDMAHQQLRLGHYHLSVQLSSCSGTLPLHVPAAVVAACQYVRWILTLWDCRINK